MDFQLGFGRGTQPVAVPDSNLLGVLLPNPVPEALPEQQELRRALAAPVGTPPLRAMVQPGQTVAIVTSDITRPCPSARMLPALLEELWAAGIRRQDVTLVFALGSHRNHTLEEQKKLAGDAVFGDIRCIDGNPDDCLLLGTTSRGTPVSITRAVAEADFRICLGNIEYHYFAGYSGGAKAIMPGVSTRDAIQHNHAMMVRPEAHAGNLDTNPVRQDIEEAGKICGIDFILNVVLDAHKQILLAVAGDVVAAHRAGCRYLDALYASRIEAQADIVIVSQGGAPKDLNLYQTQKALDNAKHAVKPGGIIILMGSCAEGLGESTFARWFQEAQKPSDLTKRIKVDFQLGGHKAAAIAMVLEQADIFLVSEMEPDFVEGLFLKPYRTAQDALDDAMRQKGSDATVLVMPYGGSTLPQLATT